MSDGYRQFDDFSRPLGESWEMIPENGWTFAMSPARARFVNRSEGNAEIFLRPCSIYGDTVEMRLVPAESRSGILVFGFLVGFEYITFELDLSSGDLQVLTHEFHKPQPRAHAKAGAGFSSLSVTRKRCDLPGLPYEGSSVVLRLDGEVAAEVDAIDFLPESLFMFGLKGPGELSLASFSIIGPTRPRPEYLHVGLWQQGIKPTTAENVNVLLEGVRQAADAGVQLLVTPETSLVGLRPEHPEWSDQEHIQSELRRFQDGIQKVRGAPHTLIGYPDWVDMSQVEGAALEKVPLNCHRFVRPDGALGPPMAKVHVCEPGLWHGREYNLQRVCGAEVAVGVCHDAHYQDVWATGVMGGARLCLHPSSGGNYRGSIPEFLTSIRSLGDAMDVFWLRVNAGGGSAILYPAANRKQPNTLLAVPEDLTDASPTYPQYCPMGDLLAHTTIRLWDATGAYPMRTLRSGRKRYEIWSSLVPQIREV